MNNVDAAKRAARDAAGIRRHGLDAAGCGLALAGHVMRDIVLVDKAVVAGYWPMGDEIDIRPLLHSLHEQGHPVTLPVTPALGQKLSFHLWEPGDVLIQERFGTLRPTGERLVPNVFFIPLLAFDRMGGRLGYGGGFYDRTLAAQPDAARIGCAFAAQQVDTVPVGPYDIRLHAVATEHGIIRCGG